MRSSLRLQHLGVFLAALAVVLLTRLPLLPGHLYSFDTVNLALALEKFDPLLNQPQPPGYPFFVGEARLVHLLLASPEQTFAVLRLALATLTLVALFYLGRLMFSTGTALVAAALLAANPVFWYGSITNSLRMHEALFSCLLAYPLWRVTVGRGPAGRANESEDDSQKRARIFLLASLALGLAGGFRPVVELRLFPLWLWAGWELGGWKLLQRAVLALATGTLAWVMVLVVVAGGPLQLVSSYYTYVFEQFHQTSALMAPADGGWKRMVGRALIWTALGSLVWVWALPGLWRGRAQWADWPRRATFFALWFVPSFSFDVLVHTADPDHIIFSLPALALLGAVALGRAEQRITRASGWLVDRGLAAWALLVAGYVLWQMEQPPQLPVFMQQGVFALHAALALAMLTLLPWRGRAAALSEAGSGAGNAEAGRVRHAGPLVFLALVANILLFFNFFRLPEPPSDMGLGRLRALVDPLQMSVYETSYARVRWVDFTTDQALSEIAQLKRAAGRDVAIIWTRDATPEWRKLAYYFPRDHVYVLEERGDPTVESTKARRWVGPKMQEQYAGTSPVRIPLPGGARIIWLLAGGKDAELGRAVPLKRVKSVSYTDLPEAGESIRWGAFEFISPPVAANNAAHNMVTTPTTARVGGKRINGGSL